MLGAAGASISQYHPNRENSTTHLSGEDAAKATGAIVGSHVGAIAGATKGAAIGAIGGPVGAFCGLIVGGVVGGIFGGVATGNTARDVVSHFKNS
jgi:phage tail tape-measure protein